MFQNPDVEPAEVLDLFQKRATVIKPGLERIKAALDILGSPGINTPRIVIAGTNGKGSTSGFIWRLLAACGLRAGLFSSPHLMEFRERITVSDADVSNQLLATHIQNLRKRIPSSLWDELTFFEINTILAFMVFDELETDVNVLEVGLGGRLDCVNVYDPDVSVITSIGLDHQEFLGTSLAQIAREKAGIMRHGRPVIWCGAEFSEWEAHDAIVRAAEKVGAILISGDQPLDYLTPESIRKRPDFLRRNFKLAVTAVREFASGGNIPALTPDTVRKAITEFDRIDLPWPVTLNGRFDLLKVSKGGISRTVLVDVCHNPHGAKALALALEETGIVPVGAQNPCLISVLADKDASGIWAEIRGKIKEAIRFRIPSTRTWDAQDTRIDGVMKDSFEAAWSEALGRGHWDSQQPWLLFGSVAAVGEVFSYWNRAGWSVERVIRKS